MFILLSGAESTKFQKTKLLPKEGALTFDRVFLIYAEMFQLVSRLSCFQFFVCWFSKGLSQWNNQQMHVLFVGCFLASDWLSNGKANIKHRWVLQCQRGVGQWTVLDEPYTWSESGERARKTEVNSSAGYREFYQDAKVNVFWGIPKSKSSGKFLPAREESWMQKMIVCCSMLQKWP